MQYFSNMLNVGKIVSPTGNKSGELRDRFAELAPLSAMGTFLASTSVSYPAVQIRNRIYDNYGEAISEVCGPETGSDDRLDAGPCYCNWSEPLPDGRQRLVRISLSTCSSAVPQQAAVVSLYTTGEESLPTTSIYRSSMGATDQMVFRLFMVPEKDEFLLALLTMEPANQRLIGVFNAIIVFGFAHVVWFQLARTLPPIASSLSVMMIPVVGVFSGAWMPGETPHWQDYAAMGLILAAMTTVLVKPRAASE